MHVFKMATHTVIPISDQLDIEVTCYSQVDSSSNRKNIFSLQQSSFIHRYFMLESLIFIFIIVHLSKRLFVHWEDISLHQQLYIVHIFSNKLHVHIILQSHVHIAIKMSLWTCIVHRVARSEIISGRYTKNN